MTTKTPRKPNFVKFEPSARIQGLLGRELITSDYVAVAEAVRNAYDAGAKEITVTLFPNAPQKLVIFDNGSGMSLNEFKKVWMMPGYSEKVASPRAHGRAALGEKGIGRFAVDKLASKLVVTTKKKSDSDAIMAEFDWTRFDNQAKKLRDIKIRVQQVKDEELISQGQGTRLELTKLRTWWDEKDWTNLRNELTKLVSPSGRRFDFKLTANARGWESGLIAPSFKGDSSYEYTFTINKGGKIVWGLERPDKILEQLNDQGVTERKNDAGIAQTENSFGLISGRFYYFDRSDRIKKQGYEPGIAIYRDGFRVEPYGRGNDDWLGVKSLRAKRQGHAPISPSKLFGYIEISRANNEKLRDLTNREGIQNSPEFEDFRKRINERFQHLASFIAKDKSNMPPAPTIAAQRLSGTRLTRAQAFGEMADQLAHQLRQPMSHIANAVRTLQTYVAQALDNDERVNKYTDMILRNIERLDSNIDGLSDLAVRLKEPVSEIDLIKLVQDLVAAHEPNFEQQGVKLSMETELQTATAKFSKPALEFALDNYLNNALKVTAKATKSTKREVRLTVTKGKNGKTCIAVEDCGDGISPDKANIIFNKPVASKDGSGIGLYFSKLHLDQFNGRVGYERTGDGMKFYVEI